MAKVKIIQIILLMTMTVLGAVAALFLKKASNSGSVKELAISRHLYIGGMLYISTAIINIYLLKHLDYTVLLPLTSITYIWTMLLSNFFLKETIGKKKIIGVLGIVTGSILLIL